MPKGTYSNFTRSIRQSLTWGNKQPFNSAIRQPYFVTSVTSDPLLIAKSVASFKPLRHTRHTISISSTSTSVSLYPAGEYFSSTFQHTRLNRFHFHTCPQKPSSTTAHSREHSECRYTFTITALQCSFVLSFVSRKDMLSPTNMTSLTPTAQHSGEADKPFDWKCTTILPIVQCLGTIGPLPIWRG